MAEELNLVKDLAIILIAAGFFTLVSKALKQPLILGYIIAGFVVGPKLGLFHLASAEAVHEWSEIGIIFLLFALGLEFSFKKLLKVGSGAMLMAGIKCLGMFVIGILLGELMGWSLMEGIFLGGLMGMSSTTIIIKAYDDMGLKNKPYAPLIFGSLVVEDLIAVLLMVLLSTLAVSGKFEGAKMALALGKLVFFLVLWFLVGIYVIPTILKKARKLLNDETLLILAIGLCFTMVVIADSVGFSSALGAFVMGSILAETLEGERIEHLLTHIKNLFGAIFFVSVGMMVDPVVIGAQWGPILIITLVAMVGILIFSSMGALVAGAGLDTAVHSGFTLAQLGEFAFIIAALGVNMGVLRDFIYPVVIAVSVITTFTTPYMIKAATPVSAWLNRVLPKKFIDRVNSSSTADFEMAGEAEKNHWKSYLKLLAIRVGVYGVLLLAVVIGSAIFLDSLFVKLFPSLSDNVRNLLEIVTALVVMTPFNIGLTMNSPSMRSEREALLKERHFNLWKLYGLDIIRVLMVISFVLALILARFNLSVELTILIVLLLVALFFALRRFLGKRFSMEEKFFSNLDATDVREQKRAPVTTEVRRNLEKYNVHIESVYLSPDSKFAGMPLRELPFRHHASINIIKIQRGGQSFIIPSGDTPVYPYDRLLAVGTEEQLASFRELMKGEITPSAPVLPDVYYSQDDSDFVVQPREVYETGTLCGKTLRELKMRSYDCMVICYLRDGQMVTNPSPDEPFRPGDLVWMAGGAENLDRFLRCGK